MATSTSLPILPPVEIGNAEFIVKVLSTGQSDLHLLLFKNEGAIDQLSWARQTPLVPMPKT
jgi:hypothetical protein